MYTRCIMNNFVLDYQNIIVLVSLAIHGALLWLLYRYGRKTSGGKAYAAAILTIAGWVLPMVLFRSHFLGEVVVWARLLYVMASFTSTTFLFFTFVFPDNKKVPWWLQTLLLVENLFIVFLCLHPTWMIQGVDVIQGAEDIIIWGPLYSVYVNHISLLFLIGFIVLFLKWRKAKGLVRRQILFILVGYFFGANLAMVTNLILPWFGNFDYNWLGQFFSTLVAVFTTYAILKHRLLNIKVIATEGFLLILNLLLFVRLVLSSNPQDFVVNSIVSFSIFIISYVLIKSVQEEVKRREETAKLAHSLEKANIRLQELDHQKTEFLSIASHQLRTPLSIIKGYIELIKDGAFGHTTKKTKEILDNMDESNERLVKLVDEFLDITRIEQGRTKFHFEKTDINALITSVVQELTDRAADKKIKIIWKPVKLIKHIYVDEEKIRHVVFNYIDNAIKYSEKGTIHVSLEKEKKGYTIRIKDKGIGFEKEDYANLFQKFYRGKNVEGTNVNGTGLGIYVCRKFIEKHNGVVWGHSAGLGKGSEFGFWVPAYRGKGKE